MSRTLYGIGAGPGDPELITLLGLRHLRAATHVFLPATRRGASYAGAIVARYLEPQRQQVLELVCPAYRDRSAIEARWDELARVVASTLPSDGTGAFVCEGDPSLYSTFLHLRRCIERLETDIQVVTIPGVDSVAACAAAAGLPLAIWDERLLITPMPSEPQSLPDLLTVARTIAILKAGRPMGSLVDVIEHLQPGVQATLVRRAGRAEQQVLSDLDAIRALEADYFTTVLIQRSDL